MREILFRGKRLNNGEWVYGFYAYELRGEHYIHADEGAWYDGPMLTMVEVERETVGQYTGIDDKIGVKIFDGDIVSFTTFDYNGVDRQHVGVVRWGDCHFFIDGTHVGNDDALFDLSAVRCEDEEFEVIGNITDNPELLEGKE